jgi:hypothetical protein
MASLCSAPEVKVAHEVERPAYEVVCALQRFDERDTVFAREALILEIHRRRTRFIACGALS